MLTSLALFAVIPLAASEPVTMKLIPSGASERTGGYRPMQAKFGAEATARPRANMDAPQYGTLQFGEKKIAFALSEPEGKSPILVVDANANGDLSDDAPVEWNARKNGEYQLWMGTTKADLGKGAPVAITMYRFDPKDPKREALKNSLFYYGDYGYEVGFKLDGKPYTTFVAGEPTVTSSIAIDRDNNKQISYNYEMVKIGQPFNFTGTTYVLNIGAGGLTLDRAATSVPKSPMPPNLAVGQKVLAIKTTALDGKPVDLGKDYKGKIVMVDFWATWCGPCIGELPNVKAAYAANHSKGFEILGVSFDRENMAEKLKEFTDKNGMPWRQVYEGKFWSTEVGKRFDVSAIPFTLLVDGDTGKILASGEEMRGPGLTDLIAQKLAAKKARR